MYQSVIHLHILQYTIHAKVTSLIRDGLPNRSSNRRATIFIAAVSLNGHIIVTLKTWLDTRLLVRIDHAGGLMDLLLGGAGTEPRACAAALSIDPCYRPMPKKHYNELAYQSLQAF